MTREDVIDFFNGRNKIELKREFLKRWVEERRKATWRDEFLYLVDDRLLMKCFKDMFILHQINIVEDINTGAILRLV